MKTQDFIIDCIEKARFYLASSDFGVDQLFRGDCGTLALALAKALERRNIGSSLVVCCEPSSFVSFETKVNSIPITRFSRLSGLELDILQDCIGHVALECEGVLYDYRGVIPLIGLTMCSIDIQKIKEIENQNSSKFFSLTNVSTIIVNECCSNLDSSASDWIINGTHHVIPMRIFDDIFSTKNNSYVQNGLPYLEFRT
jgi:hypothetical protein